MTPRYQKLLDQRKRLDVRHDKILAELRELEASLSEERSNLHITCNCGATLRVGDLTLLLEDRGSYDNYGETYYPSIVKTVVCPVCTEPLSIPESKEFFPNGIERNVNVTISWHQRERIPEAAQELLAPSIKRREDRRVSDEQNRKLEQARRILRDAGELL